MKNIRTALESAKRALSESPRLIVSHPESGVVRIEVIPNTDELALIDLALNELGEVGQDEVTACERVKEG